VTAADYARRSFRLIEEERLQEAFAAAEAGLALSPNDAILHYNAALSAARLGRDAAARAHLDAIAADDALAAAAIVLTVDIASRAGDLDAAVAAIERANGLAARDDAKLRDAGVRLAGALMDAGRLADAGRVAAAILG
jgi:tetratricopeptide (TPR) repeat protein